MDIACGDSDGVYFPDFAKKGTDRGFRPDVALKIPFALADDDHFVSGREFSNNSFSDGSCSANDDYFHFESK
jgi:hypothetical protein